MDHAFLMTKKILLFFSRFTLLIAVPLILPVGCAIQPVPVPRTVESDAYRSELADPEAKALYAYAEFRMLAGESRWDDAITSLRRAVAFDPQTEYLRMNLAKALLHKDEADASIEILQEVLQQSPDNVEGHELLGDLLGYQDQNEAAVKHYRLALDLDPDNEIGWPGRWLAEDL